MARDLTLRAVSAAALDAEAMPSAADIEAAARRMVQDIGKGGAGETGQPYYRHLFDAVDHTPDALNRGQAKPPKR